MPQPLSYSFTSYQNVTILLPPSDPSLTSIAMPPPSSLSFPEYSIPTPTVIQSFYDEASNPTPIPISHLSVQTQGLNKTFTDHPTIPASWAPKQASFTQMPWFIGACIMVGLFVSGILCIWTISWCKYVISSLPHHISPSQSSSWR